MPGQTRYDQTDTGVALDAPSSQLTLTSQLSALLPQAWGVGFSLAGTRLAWKPVEPFQCASGAPTLCANSGEPHPLWTSASSLACWGVLGMYWWHQLACEALSLRFQRPVVAHIVLWGTFCPEETFPRESGSCSGRDGCTQRLLSRQSLPFQLHNPGQTLPSLASVTLLMHLRLDKEGLTRPLSSLTSGPQKPPPRCTSGLLMGCWDHQNLWGHSPFPASSLHASTQPPPTGHQQLS